MPLKIHKKPTIFTWWLRAVHARTRNTFPAHNAMTIAEKDKKRYREIWSVGLRLQSDIAEGEPAAAGLLEADALDVVLCTVPDNVVAL